MKYDIARTESATVKIVSSAEDSRLVQLEINPKSSFIAADLDHKTEKLSEASLEKFKKKSKLDQLEILGIQNEDISAAFKVKDAELLENGNFLITARLLNKPKEKDNKWNRADHIGQDFSETYIKDPSGLPEKFTASTVFDFEGFQEAKEHVPELQIVDTRFNYSNINSSSTLKKRISGESYTGIKSNRPLQFTTADYDRLNAAHPDNMGGTCDPNLGFSCSSWYTHNIDNPDFWTGNP